MVRQLRVGYHTGYEQICIIALPYIVASLLGKFLPNGWAGVATYFCPLLSLMMIFDVKIK